MYKLSTLIPLSHLEKVKDAIFKAGAGSVGNYSHCCWQTLGEGQFMPLPGNNAFIGQTNQLEKVAEYRVDTWCSDETIRQVIAALKNAHPYETPAYEVIKLEDF